MTTGKQEKIVIYRYIVYPIVHVLNIAAASVNKKNRWITTRLRQPFKKIKFDLCDLEKQVKVTNVRT
jgi:hypothetical protein